MDGKSNKDSSYFAVPVDNFEENEVVPFTLYIFDGDRHSHFCESFKYLDLKKLDPDYRKNTNLFYVRRQDGASYRSYVRKNFFKIMSKGSLKQINKVDTIYDASRSILEPSFAQRVAPSSKEVNIFVRKVVDFILTTDLSYDKLIINGDPKLYIFYHSIHVLIYMVKFLRFLDLKDMDMLINISMGMYLHDIGKSRIEKRLVNKSENLSPREMIEMKKHCSYGLRMIRSEMKIENPLVLGVVYNHHERLDGSGYSKGIKTLSLHEKCAAIIDEYDYLISDKSDFKGISFEFAEKIMTTTEKYKLDNKLVNFFLDMIKKNI